jgi:two-component system response regulator LytT
MINKIVIIEDEKLNADRLSRLIRIVRPEINILTVLESIAESLSWFEENSHPDLVLMDIRLSDGLSFDILNNITISCPIIFTTAYDEYAVQAFKHNAIDYLLKPIDLEELELALNKAEQSGAIIYDKLVMENLIELLKPKDFRTRFLLPYKDGYKTILTGEVSYIFVEHKLTTAHMNNGSETVLQQTMDELELQLNPKLFFRANRQFIINIEAVVQVLNYFNGKLKVILKGCQEEIIISRDKASALKSWMDY